MGGFGKDSSAPLTRYRKTIVTFDDFHPVLLQPPVQYERPAEAIGQTKDSKKSKVHYVNQIGWQMRAYQFDYGTYHEFEAAQDGTLSVAGGKATIAASHTESDYMKQSGLSGVTYNAGVPATGRKGIQKTIASGDSWSQSLTADATAYPGSSTTDESTSIDRVYVTKDPHSPDEQIHFWFEVPGHSVAGYACLVEFYFCGPAGSDSELTGTGRYMLRLYGDGIAWLFERGESSSDWALRKKFVYEPARQMVAFKAYMVSIVSDCKQDINGAFHGTKMTFVINGISNTSLVPALINVAQNAVTMQLDPHKDATVYYVPKLTDEPTSLECARVNVRRDVRAVFHVLKSTFPEEGSLQDSVVSLDFHPDDSQDLTFEWYSVSPTGSSIEGFLYDAETDTELSLVSSFTDEYGGSKTYTVPDRSADPDLAKWPRHFYARFDFTSDGEKTATLTAWRLFRDPVTETLAVTPTVVDDSRATPPSLPQTVVSSVNIQEQDTDPQNSAAVLTLNDYFGNVDFLTVRDCVPVKIETTYDSGGTNKSVLFRGYTQGASSKVKRGSAPFPSWREYNVPCCGEWRRLLDTLSPRRFTWFNRDTNKPWRVTDLVVTLLLSAGYPESMVEDPNLDIELFGFEENQSILEPSDPIAPVIVRILTEYLGGYLTFDENAGTRGMWRILQQKTAPYNNLARFMTGHPGSGKLPHVDGAYGTDTVGSQTIVKTFIQFGSDSLRVDRPEGNCVVVFGSAPAAASAQQGYDGAAMMTQVLYNVDSFNFLNLGSSDDGYPDPTNPDFLGWAAPIKVYDPTLTSEFAVNWVARRVFQYACFSRKTLTFKAPLILVTDSEDAEQTNPRPLRFYDAVEVWNGVDYDQYLVKACTPSYTKDGFQWATYELITTPNISDFMAPPVGDDHIARMFRAVMQGMFGLSPGGSISKPQHKQYWGRTQDWMALPEPTLGVIQDLDNASGTFGDLIPMLGFDGLG